MENASKALIIAGAILISILIVGLGVIIYNNVADVAQSGTLDEQQISAHNSPFENYFGNNVSGSNVRALITNINNSNRTAQSNDESVGNFIFVTITPKNSSGGAGTPIETTYEGTVSSSEIKSGKNYTVAIGGDGNFSDEQNSTASYWTDGYIKHIKITEN